VLPRNTFERPKLYLFLGLFLAIIFFPVKLDKGICAMQTVHKDPSL